MQVIIAFKALINCVKLLWLIAVCLLGFTSFMATRVEGS